MPKFQIEQYELYCITYEVEAESEAEAILKLSSGEAYIVDDSTEYVEVAERYGREQTPSIRSIKKVEDGEGE